MLIDAYGLSYFDYFVSPFLWRTYGEHDIVLTILCDKDDVGTCIYNLREALEKRNISINKIDVSVSIFWEKMHLVP